MSNNSFKYFIETKNASQNSQQDCSSYCADPRNPILAVYNPKNNTCSCQIQSNENDNVNYIYSIVAPLNGNCGTACWLTICLSLFFFFLLLALIVRLFLMKY